MKSTRFFALLIVLVVLLSLAACVSKPNVQNQPPKDNVSDSTANNAPDDDNALTEYDSGIGLKLRMMKGMEKSEVQGVDLFYVSDECMMTTTRESFEIAANSGVETGNMSVEAYCAILKTGYGLEDDFKSDSYGNLSNTYVKNIGGSDFLYYVTVRKGTDSFWVINFACVEDQKDTYLPMFEEWGNTIEVE